MGAVERTYRSGGLTAACVKGEEGEAVVAEDGFTRRISQRQLAGDHPSGRFHLDGQRGDGSVLKAF